MGSIVVGFGSVVVPLVHFVASQYEQRQVRSGAVQTISERPLVDAAATVWELWALCTRKFDPFSLG